MGWLRWHCRRRGRGIVGAAACLHPRAERGCCDETCTGHVKKAGRSIPIDGAAALNRHTATCLAAGGRSTGAPAPSATRCAWGRPRPCQLRHPPCSSQTQCLGVRNMRCADMHLGGHTHAVLRAAFHQPLTPVTLSGDERAPALRITNGIKASGALMNAPAAPEQLRPAGVADVAPQVVTR